MSESKITIRDVAQKAGVSVSTVSRVLTCTGRINAETKARVEEIIRELDYRPNMAAQSLKTQKTRNIFLIVPDIANPFYADIAKALQALVRERGYILTLYNTNEDLNEELKAIDAAIEAYAGGIVFASISQYQAVIDKLLASGITSVLLNSYDSCEIDCVHGRRECGTYLSTRYLIEHNHRRIAFAGGSADTTIGKSRKNGYLKALAQEGILPDRRFMFEMGFSEDAGYKAGKYFSALSERPTAICCANDILAMGVLVALREEGIHVPEDISVTGMDNILYSHISSPPLTSVTNDGVEFAKHSFQLLFDRLDGVYTGEAREIILDRTLVVRESVATI